MFRTCSRSKSLLAASISVALAVVAGCTEMNPLEKNSGSLITAPPVTALTSWVSGTTNNKVSGSNRLMTVMVMGESTANLGVTGVTYGGQAMTKQSEKMFYVSGSRTYASIFSLTEAGVNAATTGTIAVTWSGTPLNGGSVYSVLLSNVDQTTPVSATASHGLTGTSIATTTLSAAAGDMVVMAGATESNNTQTFDSGFTKMFESNSSWGDAVGGYKAGTDAGETPKFTQSASGRMALCAIAVRAVASAPVSYTLAVTSLGGTITLNPPGGVYASGTAVTVTATPDVNYEFNQWSGSHSGTVNPAVITMDGNKAITAEYLKYSTLTVGGSVNCTVDLNPPGGRYLEGTVVTLTAIPDPGYQFSHWSDDLCCTGNPATKTMSIWDLGIRAHCVPDPATAYTLTTIPINGHVFLNPPGGTYPPGTVVTVTAEPFQNYDFTGWSGDLSGTVNPTTITMDSNKTVTANFVDVTTQYVTAVTGWVSGTNNPKVSASNRLMTVMVMGESNATFSATGVTYGGQAMTKQSERMYYVSGNRTYASIFTLKEAGVNAATSGAIAVTWSAAPSVGSSVYSVLLSNVDQTTPVSGAANNALTGTTIATTSPLSNYAGDMLIMIGATESNNTQTFNNGFTKQFESNTSWGDGVGGYKVGKAIDETPSFTQSSSGRMAMCAIVVKRYR